MSPNFVLLESEPLKARHAVDRCSSAHPQEATSEEGWADVFAHGYATTREAAMAARMASRKGLVEMPVACEQTIE